MAEGSSSAIQSASQFKKTPTGLKERWAIEIEAAKKNQQEWLKQAEDANRRFLGEKEAGTKDAKKSQINLFHANINIIQAILFGQIPKVDVSRRFADPDDEEARVASEALERHLNSDIEEDDEDFVSEVKDIIQDWKITGFGQARLRYEVETEDQEEVPAVMGGNGEEKAPAVPAYAKKTDESIDTEYVYWRDFLWSPCRRWKDVRWVAFRVEMTRDQANKRFGEKVGKTLPLQDRKPTQDDVLDSLKEVWSRAQIWEIWSKEEKCVYWYCEGYPRMLDQKPDTLELEGFFPCPRPLISNTTTTKLMPKPDLEIDRHIYDEIDELASRLRALIKGCRLTGAFDKSFPELGRILHEAQEGQLIGVDNWAALGEKGGLAGVMQFVPLKDVAEAINVLTQKLVEKITLLYQVTGISDIVRGQAESKATATEQSIKAQFASTRLQTDQDEVARFATDLQKLRAEIISKHYDPETIIRCSNLLRTELMPAPQPPPVPGMPPPPPPKQIPNMDLINRAVQLIKSDIWQYRIEVKSDSISLRDYAALKSERVETIQTMAALFQQAVPMVQIYPKAAPFLLDICDWLIAATKGSQQMQGMFQRFKAEVEEAANAPPTPAPPDPKIQAAQVKAQAEMGKAKLGLVQTQMDTQAHVQKTGMEMQQAREEHAQNMQSMEQKQRAEALKNVNQTLHPSRGAE
jgi:hypothetical protein